MRPRSFGVIAAIEFATATAFLAICLCGTVASAAQSQPAATVEQWGIWELALQAPSDGNPFVDVNFRATFHQGDQHVTVTGFYDGDGIYRLRFMPGELGRWTYETSSNLPGLQGVKGELTCTAPQERNHGPVVVANTFHFAYADGTPYVPIGTTCYAWIHQGDALEEQTLRTLKDSPFNKLRMCVFPKHYAYNSNEPVYYPFEGTPPATWDLTRFNPAFFQHLEKRIAQLRDLGIEADIILFHPYDKGHWGFDRMPADADDRYLKYVVSRLAAYRNAWWSMANEYDFMKEKKEPDWDRFFQIVQRSDPYGHLRSIHNGALIYNQNQPWVTHASMQVGSAVEDFGRAGLFRDAYRKPVVYDEVKYEGNFNQRWGNLSAEEMVHRFWIGTIAGTYVGHGETYKADDEVVWWSKGGILKGQSPARLAFLRKVLEDGPPEGIEPIDAWQDARVAGKAGSYYLVAFGKDRPSEWQFELPKKGLAPGVRMRVEILDTWNMTVTPVDQVFTTEPYSDYRIRAQGVVKLPGRPYIMLRIMRE